MSAHALRLQVGLVGEQARHDPYLSGFGQAARLAVVNGFGPGDYFSGFGLRVRRDEDLSQVLTFSQTRQHALANTLDIPLPESWDLSQWLPFELREARLEEGWQFRHCAPCLRTGFHTLLFQLPWIHRCPWHCQRLRTGCHQCDRPMVVSGADGRPLLRCDCGQDAIDAVASLTPQPLSELARSQFLTEYLAWAKRERRATTVIAPCSGHADLGRLSTSVRLPPHLSSRCQDQRGVAAVAVCPDRALRAAPEWATASTFQAFRVLLKDDPGVMELPDCMSPAFNAAARQVATSLPPGSLTDREMSLFFPGLSGDRAREFLPARRKSSTDLSYVPPQRIGGRSYLHLHTISPVVLRTAWAVLQEAIGAGLGGRVPIDSRVGAGAAVVAARILARGYVEGMRSILARHVPAILDDPKLSPRYSEPWVWMRRVDTGLRCAIYWSPEPLLD